MVRQRDRSGILAVSFLVLAFMSLQPAQAFQSVHRHPNNRNSLVPKQQAIFQKSRTTKPLHIFGRNSNDDGADNDKSSDEDGKKKFSIPFFGRQTGEKEAQQEQPQQSEVTPKASVATIEKPKVQEREEDSNDPKLLRARAERARLEAERMDAELTLEKIDKLERQLIKAKSKGDSIEDLQRQLDALQAKLRGDPPPPKSTTTTNTASFTGTFSDQEVIEAAKELSSKKFNQAITSEDELMFVPLFLLKILASFVGMEVPKDVDDFNKTEFVSRWSMAKELDYSFVSNYTKPSFTQAEIDEAKQKIVDGNRIEMMISDAMIEKAGGNATQLALNALEYNLFFAPAREKVTQMPLPELFQEMMNQSAADNQLFQEMMNQSAADNLYTTYYPKCTVKEDGEPTVSQVDALAKTVLPPAKFSSSSKPQKVPGGYIISGSHKYENGDDLIDAIDKELAKTSLLDKMTVLYAAGLGQQDDDQPVLWNQSISSLESFEPGFSEVDLEDPDPVLYVTGPDIVSERNRLGLTITSILGIATSWYLSIYPFLLNDGIGKRVDQELELLEANLQPDLTWLTDLSFPLFVTFIVLQVVHELGHRLVAASYGVKLTLPTFVPSLITGITSSVTTFKTLPKNKEAMFDITAAGPLAGISASAVALAIGCKLTLVADPAYLPALPLDILRQSTLGGGIIDNIIKGSLYVPEGAPTSGIMISLHPIAIAGYISLVVNALSLLPIGTTDGGRLTMALFDRVDKCVIGSLTLLLLLYFGLFGSDLFLFYFSFVIAFQTGNEIPSRNEVDEVGFSRAIVAIVAYGLAILSLVPFQ